MSKNHYGTTLSDYVKNHQPTQEFVYQRTDEIDFINFSLACQEASPDTDAEPIPFYKLEKLWFETTTFQKHWLKATREANNNIIWTAGHCLFTRAQVLVVMLGWMHYHERNM